ncbi:hypothetical protein FKM82_001987 [Ascaphus truei]
MGVPTLAITTLLGLLAALVSSAENGTEICQLAPTWSIGGEEPMAGTLGQVTVLGPLRDKLTLQGLTNISYIIVNDQSYLSRLKYPELQRRAPTEVPVYQQSPFQPDVWQILNGEKDDFYIYDRQVPAVKSQTAEPCGRLTFHIRLPLSFLHFPYVEAAIRSTYSDDYCGNCSFYSNSTLNGTAVSTANDSTVSPTAAPVFKEGGSSTNVSRHSQDKHAHHNPSNNRSNQDHSQHHPTSSHGDQEHNHPINRNGDPGQKQHPPVGSHGDHEHKHPKPISHGDQH